MKSEIQIKNSAGVCRIEIEGTIGVPEEWQFDQPEARVATYEKFRDTVRRIAGIDAPQIVVDIRSTGGDVNDALLIHDALCSLDAHITTRCYGYTASAATIIAQAASPGCREISANALYLIHNSICTAEGNAEELATRIDLLRKTDARLAEVYAARSGRTPEEFTLLMAENNGSGRWLSPQEALAAGLVDRIIEPATTEKTPAAQATPAGQWRKLLGKLGLVRPADALPPDRNILHFGDPEKGSGLRTSELALHEGQQFAAPTRTLPREDPSIGETTPSANQRAYAEDAKQLIR
jgi:ATP-dependent protease ClpP protease subunit